MSLIDFIRPTQRKMIIFGVLVVYILACVLFTAQFSLGRSKRVPQRTVSGNMGIFIAYPAVVLTSPFIYLSEHVFTGAKSLRQLETEDGGRNLPMFPDPQYDQPLMTTTSWGMAVGLVAELLILYILTCLLVMFMPRKR